MGKVTGFLEIERKSHDNHSVDERLTHFGEFSIAPSDATLAEQGARCMDCGIPYCHHGCPVHNVIPDWNDLVYHGDWRAAAEILHSTNNFPEVTGRVCPAPCEAACTLNLIDSPVAIKDIEYAIAERAFKEGWCAPSRASEQTNKKIAVVGSGPAGMAAAQQLARMGHKVTLFEKNKNAGGLLRYGIPDFKLEKHIIDRRLAQMIAEGVKLKTGIHVTSLQMFDNYDAVLLACGSEEPRDLNITGREAQGIHFAMPYLMAQNQRIANEQVSHDISAKGKNVVVIGGGDTGSDCIGTANRQGAQSVTQLEILPQPPDQEDKATTWPHWPLKLRTSSSHEEGVMRDWSVASQSFVTTPDGQLRAIKAVRLNDKMKKIPGSEFEIKSDLVLLAMGFVHPVHEGLLRSAQLALDTRGNILAQDEQGDKPYATSKQGVFACGDMRRGQSLVVWAIREGRLAAQAIHTFLIKQKSV